MFKDLLVFEKQRTGKEAFGFFLAYLLFSGLLVGIITSFFSTSVAPSGFAEGFEQGLEEGQAVGAYFYSVLSLALSALILFRKGHLKSFGFVLIGLSSGVLALFLVAFLGLVPTAYLTTIKPVDRVPDGNA
jgi:hypothetical protein|tara:strand:- start:67 stop:459 length:393 start_codon:yes stop_codon:yes gene_type:complete